MDNPSWIQILGMTSSIALPLFNIPLMARIIRRRSSADLSLIWVLGVFFSLVGMTPAGCQSPDMIFKVFTLINVVLFAGVTFSAVYFRCKGQ